MAAPHTHALTLLPQGEEGKQTGVPVHRDVALGHSGNVCHTKVIIERAQQAHKAASHTWGDYNLSPLPKKE
jgi:hypothetical protein